MRHAIQGGGKIPVDANGSVPVNANVISSSNYTALQTIGTTAIAFPYASDASGILLKVTHATQTIQVGQGATAAEAIANSAVALPYAPADLIQEIGRGGEYYALLGSGAGTTVHVSQF